MPWTERDTAEVKARKAASNAEAYERHHGFNLSAQDNHMKYERFSFLPNAGTNDKTANELYRTNWDLIDWES